MDRAKRDSSTNGTSLGSSRFFLRFTDYNQGEATRWPRNRMEEDVAP